MHLLNAETRKLETFVGDLVPDYAILSHTWGVDEVSFTDLTDASSTGDFSRVEKKQGYFKIQKTCEQALEDNLEYAWVDTCCIDKSSSAELSEAINSMFSWYRYARICYVYLSDVSMLVNRSYSYYGSTNPNEEITGPEPIMYRSEDGSYHYSIPNLMSIDCMQLLSQECPKFFNSRWFSRGWTLQELVAPRLLMFFDRGWKVIGDRESFAEAIEQTTNVSPAVLGKPWNMAAICIAERMSWAAHRKTTRLEDEAYSLLGILGINMPLLYGEGRRAFTRLQEAIIGRSSDQSIFPWESSAFYHRSWIDTAEWSDIELEPHEDPEYRRSTVLAPSVAYFEYSGRIRTLGNVNSTHFAFTNSGLQINLPTVSLGVIHYQGQQIKMVGAILNCRIDGGWIMLRLYEVDGSRNVYSVFENNKNRRMMYVDASAARSATCVPLTILDPEPQHGVYLRRLDNHSEIPLQLTLPIDHAALANFGLSIDGLFPGSSWRTFYDVRGGGKKLRCAQFSGQRVTGPGLACGTILLTRKATLGAKVLVSFRCGMGEISRLVVQLRYWPNVEFPAQECRCYQRPCRHRLNAAPCEELLTQDSTLSIEEISSDIVADDLNSSKDMIVLWPGNLTIGASLQEEVVLGVKEVFLELEISSEPG